MPRFHVGVPIVVLAKYANLYPAGSGIIRGVISNPARELFDEYQVEFAGGVIETVHDFQAVEDASTWPLVYAAFNREIAAATTQTRGRITRNREVFSATPFEIDLQFGEHEGRSFLIGQVLEKGGVSTSRLKLEVRLTKDSQPIEWTVATDLSEFEFSDVPSPANTIEILVRETRQRILVNIPERKG
jgi:hypothetical protein